MYSNSSYWRSCSRQSTQNGCNTNKKLGTVYYCILILILHTVYGNTLRFCFKGMESVHLWKSVVAFEPGVVFNNIVHFRQKYRHFHIAFDRLASWASFLPSLPTNTVTSDCEATWRKFHQTRTIIVAFLCCNMLSTMSFLDQ